MDHDDFCTLYPYSVILDGKIWILSTIDQYPAAVVEKLHADGKVIYETVPSKGGWYQEAYVKEGFWIFARLVPVAWRVIV